MGGFGASVMCLFITGDGDSIVMLLPLLKAIIVNSRIIRLPNAQRAFMLHITAAITQ